MTFLHALQEKVSHLRLDYGEDPDALACEALLVEVGSTKRRCLNDQTLYQHLRETRALLAGWSQERHVQFAGLFHSIYIGEVFAPTHANRRRLRGLIGTTSEQLVYLYCIWTYSRLDCTDPETRRELEHALHEPDTRQAMVMINIASQADAGTTLGEAPSVWLSAMCARVEEWRRTEGEAKAPEWMATVSGALTAHNELELIDNYRQGLSLLETDPASALEHLERCTSICPFLFEPWLWRAYGNYLRGEDGAAHAHALEANRWWARCGIQWDRRLKRNEWREILDSYKDRNYTNPRANLALSRCLGACQAASTDGTATPDAADSNDAVSRLSQYLRSFAEMPRRSVAPAYPIAPKAVTYRSELFPLTAMLRDSYGEIRREVGAIADVHYHPLNHRADQVGHREIIVLLANGDVVRTARGLCPTLYSILENYDELFRAGAGKVYLSRLRPRTYIYHGHRPEPALVRYYFGIQVPSDGCKCSVGNYEGTWQDGGALAIDGANDYEESNDSDMSCIVLVADLWHPSITRLERQILSVSTAMATAKQTFEGVY